MKTITTEQFNALPEEKKHLWNRHYHPHEPSDYRIGYEYYTPIQINLEDAERVLEEAMPKWVSIKDGVPNTSGAVLGIMKDTLDQYICFYSPSKNLFTVYGAGVDPVSDMKVTHWMPLPKSPADDALTTALNNLKQLTK